MGTLLKYLLYALILVAIYLIGAGLYNGTINSDSTVGQVATDVTQGTKNIIRDGYEATKETVSNGYDAAKEKVQDGYQATKETVSDGYDATKEKVQDGYQATQEKLSRNNSSSDGGFVEN